MPSVAGIIVYRGLYFGMYDSIKPVVLVGPLEGNFLASFLLGWTVTTGAGIASYPLDTIRRRMMMTSGEVSSPVINSLVAAAPNLYPGRQVQGYPRCRPEDYRCRRCHVSLQGCWCQHSPWCRWCWCPVHLRSDAAAHVRQGLQGWIWLKCLPKPLARQDFSVSWSKTEQSNIKRDQKFTRGWETKQSDEGALRWLAALVILPAWQHPLICTATRDPGNLCLQLSGFLRLGSSSLCYLSIDCKHSDEFRLCNCIDGFLRLVPTCMPL